MRTRIWLLTLILGIPLIGFGVSWGIRAYTNSELRAIIRKQVPDADPARVARYTLAEYCETAGPEASEPCGADANLAFFGRSSLGTGVAGLALLAGIALAGQAARANRSRLITLFRPGLYVTAVGVTGLILAHAIIAIAVIYYGESALVNRVHFGIILAIGLGALAGVGAVGRSAFGIVKKAETFAIGKAVTADDAPGLWRETSAVAERLGALKPDQIVVGLDPTFYVTEADVVTLDGRFSGRTLFCSLPLARILTTAEFTAIVGHELGHFRGEDTAYSERFYPIYRGSAMALASLQSAGGQGSGVIALLPAIAVFSFFLERFSIAESHHSRDRELLADRAGAEATSARTMALALVKVHAFSGVWRNFEEAAVKIVSEGQTVKNAGAVFADAVGEHATPAALEGIAETHTSHPTDSHPPLAVRLGSLGVPLESVADEALVVTPASPAATFVTNAEALELELSGTYQVLLARQLGVPVASTDSAAAATG